jgi:hypothetical protein
MILLEDLSGLMALIFFIRGAWLIPPIVLFIVGMRQRKQTPDRAKTLYIFAVVYFLIGAGICATIVS